MTAGDVWFGAASLGILGGSAGAYALYRRDVEQAYRRVEGRSEVVPAPYGDIEYAEGGSGPPVLVIHGSGGGYDQGELVAELTLGRGFRWIAPSRFGYLRSACPEGATFDEQAHAYAHLLDRLGVERVAVVALSHGGPSALLFAVLYPERVSSLTLISCGVASPAADREMATGTREAAGRHGAAGAEESADGGPSAEGRTSANRKGRALVALFRHDLVYWAMARFFRGRLAALMGADVEVVAGLDIGQRRSLDRFIDYMNPVRPRSAGAAFDNQAAMPDGRIAAIRAPTLILHARDDRLQLFRNAEFARATIPKARLVEFERGGHLLLGVEEAAVRETTCGHILDHLGDARLETRQEFARAEARR